VVFNKLKEHLTVKDYCHIRLMIDSVNNLKNEISLLQNTMVNLTNQTDLKIVETRKEMEVSIATFDESLNNMAVMLDNQAEQIQFNNTMETIRNQTSIDLDVESKRNKVEFERLNKKYVPYRTPMIRCEGW